MSTQKIPRQSWFYSVVYNLNFSVTLYHLILYTTHQDSIWNSVQQNLELNLNTTHISTYLYTNLYLTHMSINSNFYSTDFSTFLARCPVVLYTSYEDVTQYKYIFKQDFFHSIHKLMSLWFFGPHSTNKMFIIRKLPNNLW